MSLQDPNAISLDWSLNNNRQLRNVSPGPEACSIRILFILYQGTHDWYGAGLEAPEIQDDQSAGGSSTITFWMIMRSCIGRPNTRQDTR